MDIREKILGISDSVIEKVHVDLWDMDVFVRNLSGSERDHFEGGSVIIEGKKRRMNLEDFRARLLVLTICDENGNRIFTEKDIKDLGKKNAEALDQIFTVAQRLSGFTKEDVEELTKNSNSDQNEDSI